MRWCQRRSRGRHESEFPSVLDVDGARRWLRLIEHAAAQAAQPRVKSCNPRRGKLEEDDCCNKNESWTMAGLGGGEHKGQVEKCALILSAALTSWQSI